MRKYMLASASEREEVKIGRKICQSNLKKSCITISKLFSSVEINGGGQSGTKEQREQPFAGGHY